MLSEVGLSKGQSHAVEASLPAPQRRLYNQRKLAGWKERIESVAERAHTTYVITNSHFESKARVNALELKAMITGKRVLAPPTLTQKYRS